MRKRPRLRYLITLSGITFSILLFLVWAISTGAVIGYAALQNKQQGTSYSMQGGSIIVFQLPAVMAERMEGGLYHHLGPPYTPIRWWVDYRSGTAGGRFWFKLVAPVWIPFLLVAVPTLLLWRGRIPPGHCRKCEYNLTGNTSGVCPECGHIIAKTLPNIIE